MNDALINCSIGVLKFRIWIFVIGYLCMKQIAPKNTMICPVEFAQKSHMQAVHYMSPTFPGKCFII